MSESKEAPRLIIWREFIPLQGGYVDITKMEDWHRHIEKVPERSAPGLINFEIEGEPADWQAMCDEIERIVKTFPYEKGKRYTIELREIR